ncbi:unnamed protein product [Clonostachys rosea f. rosea IK726]|nr:unnamed protein product [Clonostachys rosea f. rosea IK726]
MYSLRSSAGPSIRKLSGLALRQCIELGYHRSFKRFGSASDPLRLEIRKRVFRCAFGIDCVAALTLGRPLGVLLQEVDAEIWTRIHGTLYSDVNGDVDKTTKDHKIAIFRVEIDDWLASAPPTPIRTGPALSISATQDWYDLNYNETFIMLYRCQVTGYGDDMDHEVLRQCAQAAGSICLVYRRLYIGKTVNYT